MKYKHKFTIGDSLDISYPVHGRIKTEEAQLEMAEVYRKAEAFDQLAHTYEQYKESHTHDLKSTMGTKAIELLESDE